MLAHPTRTPVLSIEQLQRLYRRQVANLKNIRALHCDLAWQLDDTQFLLRDLYTRRACGGDALLEREIARLESQCSHLEESLTVELLRIERLTREIAHTRSALARRGVA